VGSDFWTSGSNEGTNCDVQDVYGWCSSGQQIAPEMVSTDLFWLSKIASAAERCLTLSFDSSSGKFKIGMKRFGCQVKFPTICERNETLCPQMKQPLCPVPSPKNVRSSTFHNSRLNKTSFLDLFV